MSRQAEKKYWATSGIIYVVHLFVWFSIVTKFSMAPEYFEADNMLSQSTRFFGEQLVSILDFRLDIDRSYLPGECFYFNGKCFGYFGITPSLLRAPLLIIPNDGIHRFAAVYAALGLALVSWSMVRIFFDVHKVNGLQPPTRKVLVGVLLLSVGSPLLLLTRVSVYHESIVWCIGWLAFALSNFLRWQQDRTRRRLFLIICACWLSAGTNPSSFLGILAISTAIFTVLGKSDQRKIGIFISGASLFGAFLMCFGVYFLKFRSLLPDPFLHESIPETAAWAEIMSKNGGHQTSLRFVPTQIVNSLRLDGMDVSIKFPWFSPRIPEKSQVKYVWPVGDGAMTIQRSLSIMYFSPLLIVGVIQLLVFKRSRHFFRRLEPISRCLLMASSFSLLVLPLMQVAISSRYFSYVYLPGSMVLIFTFAIQSQNPQHSRKTDWVFWPLAALTALVNISMLNSPFIHV